MKIIAAALVLVLIFVIQKSIYRRYWKKGLSVNLKFNKNYIEIGEAATLIETIANEKLLPLPILHVKFSTDRSLIFEDNDNSVVTDCYHRNDAFSIMSNQRITRSLKLTGKKRGVYGIERANILVKDFFLASTFATGIKTESCIYVLPEKIKTLRFEEIVNGLMGDIAVMKSLNVDNMAFRGLREYQRTDSYRAINWKQSAKMNELMVNVYDYTSDIKVRILLDLDTDNMIGIDKLVEESIKLASSFSKKLILERIGVSLVSNGVDFISDSTINVESGVETGHAITIDKALARIKKSKDYNEFIKILDAEERHIDDKAVYLIISPYHKDVVMQKILRLKNKGAAVKMIVPYYDRFGIHSTYDFVTGWEVSINEA